jgi:beta-phosphoglucomutase-like phosphatase (HAD superfamily)
MIKAIVFDFDGVLADTEPLHFRAYQEVLASVSTTLTREEYYEQLVGYNDVDCFRLIAQSRGWEPDESRIAALVADKGRVFEQIILDTDTLYAGAAGCVERMAAAFPLGIASGALKHEILLTLKRARLDHHFCFIVGSGDTPKSKPAPDPYIRAAEKHRLPPGECVAIEDSRWGIESARTAGLRTVGITHTYPADHLGAPDVVIKSLAEFTPELVRSIR